MQLDGENEGLIGLLSQWQALPHSERRRRRSGIDGGLTPLTAIRVLELRHPLQGFLGRTRHDDLVVITGVFRITKLELRVWYCDQPRTKAEETSHRDYHVVRLVAPAYYDVIHTANLLVAIVVDRGAD
jgi:hypothetical protein